VSDRLDQLLKQTCTILSNDGAENAYGQQSADRKSWPVVASNVPCLVDSLRVGTENLTEPEIALHHRKIFMREPTLSDGQKINPHHCILCDGFYYDVIDPERFTVGIPHLEVVVRDTMTIFEGETGS